MVLAKEEIPRLLPCVDPPYHLKTKLHSLRAKRPKWVPIVLSIEEI
jgi:hypothetical protein